MSKEDYANVLKFAIKMARDEYEKELDGSIDSEFYDGVVYGLNIALDKIDKSSFLFDVKGGE